MVKCNRVVRVVLLDVEEKDLRRLRGAISGSHSEKPSFSS